MGIVVGVVVIAVARRRVKIWTMAIVIVVPLATVVMNPGTVMSGALDTIGLKKNH